MTIVINTDNNKIVFDRLFKNPITTYTFSRRNSGVLKVAFTDMPEAIGSRLIQFAIKPHNEYDFANFLVYANSYNLNGGYYDMKPNFNVVAIQSLFALSANIPSVLLSMEFRWSDDAGVTWSYSNVIDTEVNANLFMGGELSSFSVSSFYEQIVPIMASFSAPINVFNNNLTVNNGGIVVSGNTKGITLSGGGNYVNLPSLSSWVYVYGSITSTSLVSQSVNTPLLSANTINGNSIATNFGSIASVQSLVVNTNTINALTGTIGTLNISSIEVGGFTATGNVNVEGSVNANTLSGQSLIANTGVLNSLNASSITTNTLLLTTFNATNVNTVTLNTNTLSATSLSGNTLLVGTANVGTESVGSLSANSINTNSLVVSANNIRLLTTNSPASSGSPGLSGTLSWDNNFLYVRTVSAWKRVALNLF